MYPTPKIKNKQTIKLHPLKLTYQIVDSTILHLDIIHMSKVRGDKYCLTIIDKFSRFPIAVPLKNIKIQL